MCSPNYLTDRARSSCCTESSSSCSDMAPNARGGKQSAASRGQVAWLLLLKFTPWEEDQLFLWTSLPYMDLKRSSSPISSLDGNMVSLQTDSHSVSVREANSGI